MPTPTTDPQAETCCLGHDLLARCPERLRTGVELVYLVALEEMRGLPRARLAEVFEQHRRAAVDGLVMADWLAVGAKKPKGAKPVVAPMAQLVAASHLLTVGEVE